MKSLWIYFFLMFISLAYNQQKDQLFGWSKLTKIYHRSAEWFGLEDSSRSMQFQTLSWARPPYPRPGCPKPHPVWPCTLLEMGHLQFLWATFSNALLSSLQKISSSYLTQITAFSLRSLHFVLTLHTLTVSLRYFYNLPLNPERSQWGLLRAFSSPNWTSPGPTAFLRKRGVHDHLCVSFF